MASGSAGWLGCEATCRTTLGTQAGADSCVYVTLSPGGTTFLNAGADANKQNYWVVTSQSDTTKPVSQVKTAGTDGRISEIQVVVGWRDDNTTTGDPDHTVVLRSGVFQ